MRSTTWAPFRPSSVAPWNLARAWTLRRRAGFAATWGELERDLAAGPGPAVDRVLAGECRLDGVPSGFAQMAALLGDAASRASDIRRLQASWLYRMLFMPDPLLERMTLAWHDHFATSQLKVDDVRAMHAQNQTLRDHARGPYGALLRAMLEDPALLLWLDAPTNRKGKPNENLARELLELFTLGVGHYSENDVKNTARALAGRTVVEGKFQIRPVDQDTGEKTILRRNGPFHRDALADLLIAEPATAERLAWRLCATFLGEGVADERARGELAEQLQRDQLHVGRAVATILRSTLFFSEKNLHSRVSDPVGFVVGTVRALECFAPPPSTLLVADWTERLGQELFFPPNVGGWPGGRGWLAGRAVVGRANFAAALVAGRLNFELRPPNLRDLAGRRGRSSDQGETTEFFADLLLGRRVAMPAAGARSPAAGAPLDTDLDPLHHSIALLLASPQAQLT